MYTHIPYITKGISMVRTQVYLTEKEKSSLESVALQKGVSQSDLIRQAIDELLGKTGVIDKTSIIDGVAGIWSERKDLVDLRDLRAGWRRRPER
jgi:hypothetical protein